MTNQLVETASRTVNLVSFVGPAPVARKHLLVQLSGVTPLLMHPISDHTKRQEIIGLSTKNPAELLIHDTRSGCIAVPGRGLKHAVRMAAWTYEDKYNGRFVDTIREYFIIGG